MSMYDDLDPTFEPSVEAALEKVAMRVHTLRLRRRVTIASSLAAVALVTALTSVAFASNGYSPRVSVAPDATTTTETPTTEPASSTSTPTSTDTTTTVDTIPTTAPTNTVPPTTDQTTPPTSVPHADLHVAFDRARLVIQSGTGAKFSFTVTNDGDAPGGFFEAAPSCFDPQIGPDTPPVGWPQPDNPLVHCMAGQNFMIGPHESKTFERSLVAGRYSGGPGNLVPAPSGTTSYGVAGYTLPITITAPAQLPFSSTFPSHVTIVSGAAHTETFTLTNRLPFAVVFPLEGPCMRPVGSTTACAQVPDAGLERLWWYRVTVDADATVTLTMDLSGTSDFMPPGPGTVDLTPGVYHLEGPGGMPLTLTVLPKP